MRLPGKRPGGALPAEEVEQLPQAAQNYIAALETKFMLNLMQLERARSREALVDEIVKRWQATS